GKVQRGTIKRCQHLQQHSANHSLSTNTMMTKCMALLTLSLLGVTYGQPVVGHRRPGRPPSSAILASVPDTGFSCEQQEFPGYFADTADEAGCQVFHICQFDGRQDSFLCPNGTIFNQQYFVCDWWFNVDCAASQQFFGLNAEIGKIPEDAAASFRSDVVAPSQQYGAPQQRQSAPAPPPTPSQFYNSPNRL
ncbi:U-scoloptoxin(01)-Cw1a-like 40, partial [Homarus americanus]